VTRLVLEQTLRYDYPAPIRRLRHHLMVLPPARHGDQRRISASLDVTGANVAVVESVDAFGNVAVEVTAARVQAAVEFVVRVVVEREVGAGAVAEVGPMLDHTRLTSPDAALAAAARNLLAAGDTGWALAERINAWVASTMRYRHDVTSVGTTAAQALSLGHGVCQDYAQVMLVISRLCGLPARYVSGHLVGEGGSHAWVEVLLPSPTVPGALEAVAYDPTNDRRAGETYLTIAVGRDYADVAPTSGSYCGTSGGGLTSRKSLEQEAVDLVPA
jgi:transglutaminase-like putative cysteine protease